MNAAVPTLEILGSQPGMPKHLESKSPSDQAALLADPVVESLLSRCLIRLGIVVFQSLEQQERQVGMLKFVEAAIDE